MRREVEETYQNIGDISINISDILANISNI